eukprot:TRINITY_DN37312_c0_g1_i1.p2 TRINITY_DN37312_c0_g1~~TRINITY_DN37312_c0_g1_i1.p2  ORF type:complete len:252 (-),score=55.92 TRINITY_DN37312_c0_g1_i1:155-910(-)
MIYIFNCVKEICSLPGKACQECGNICAQINCEPLQNGCTECGKSCSSFMERPLSTYVVIKVLLAVAQLYSCYGALSGKAALALCRMPAESPVDLKTWLQVQAAFAVAHLLFAPYFQTKVWSKMLQKLRERGSAPKNPGEPLTVPGELVHGSFREVFLHDLGVLFYAIILLANLVWSYMGSGWVVEGANCDPQQYPSYAAYYGMCFFWAAILYNACYYYCSCCAGSVQLQNPDAEIGFERAPQQPPGNELMR